MSSPREHLFSLSPFHALKASVFKEPYGRRQLLRDLMAGLSVGIIAIPLSMALAIASGAAPENGLYTAIFAGILIAITGGSRLSVSGPTAAFVVILYPITQEYGLGGLLIATSMSGIILIVMALAKLGRLIQYIPMAVTLGFTAGIAVVIAFMQLKDFLGLPIEEMPNLFIYKLVQLFEFLPKFNAFEVLIGALTLAVMILWPKLKTPMPAHLPAVILASVCAFALNSFGIEIDTVLSRFSYLDESGKVIHGIPNSLPSIDWPWNFATENAEPLSFKTIQALLPAAFAIAMLGAIESLLCAMILDGMSGKRHSANSELLGQGIGNVFVPFVGGIPATAALARSAANFKAGAVSPISTVIHSLLVLAALLFLAPVLAFMPMSSMAALLLVVAWNMSEAKKAISMLKSSDKSEWWVFFTCFFLTVFLDMVVAIVAGILLAALLFMKDIAKMTKISDISEHKRLVPFPLKTNWRVLKIKGPLFFAAADRVFSELAADIKPNTNIVLYMDSVTMLDAGGLTAMQAFMLHCEKHKIEVIFADMQFQPLRTLARAGIEPKEGVYSFSKSLSDALESIRAAPDS